MGEASRAGPDKRQPWRPMMNWDDLEPKPPAGIAVGEQLGALSIAELTARIAVLQAEIVRVSQEVERKQAVQSAAQSVFKK